MAISLSGMASGLDTDSIISQLMALEQNKVTAVQKRQVSETSIHTNLLRDLYATLGEGDADKGWTIRLYWNPLAPWIWLGAGLCALGGFISLSDRRLRIGAPKGSRGRSSLGARDSDRASSHA